MIDFECDEAAAAHGIAPTCTREDHDRERWLTYREAKRANRGGRSWTVCVGTKLALLRAEPNPRIK